MATKNESASTSMLLILLRMSFNAYYRAARFLKTCHNHASPAAAISAGFTGKSNEVRQRHTMNKNNLADRQGPVTQREIFFFWIPLAAMWLIMGIEQPLTSAFIARLADAKSNLAAYGLSYALTIIIESPSAAAVGYRRLWQGALIRHGRTVSVPVTMVLRISAIVIVLSSVIYKALFACVSANQHPGILGLDCHKQCRRGIIPSGTRGSAGGAGRNGPLLDGGSPSASVVNSNYVVTSVSRRRRLTHSSNTTTRFFLRSSGEQRSLPPPRGAAPCLPQ